jgi:hypothetical protein
VPDAIRKNKLIKEPIKMLIFCLTSSSIFRASAAEILLGGLG